jgi:hypothetical protein
VFGWTQRLDENVCGMLGRWDILEGHRALTNLVLGVMVFHINMLSLSLDDTCI